MVSIDDLWSKFHPPTSNERIKNSQLWQSLLWSPCGPTSMFNRGLWASGLPTYLHRKKCLLDYWWIWEASGPSVLSIQDKFSFRWFYWINDTPLSHPMGYTKWSTRTFFISFQVSILESNNLCGIFSLLQIIEKLFCEILLIFFDNCWLRSACIPNYRHRNKPCIYGKMTYITTFGKTNITYLNS